MGLDIGEGAVEQALGPVDRQFLGDIDVFAAAVVSPAGIALGVLVRKDRALGLEDGHRDNVLGGDQLDIVLLATKFLPDGPGQVGVGLRQASREKMRIPRIRRARNRRHGTASSRKNRGAGTAPDTPIAVLGVALYQMLRQTQ